MTFQKIALSFITILVLSAPAFATSGRTVCQVVTERYHCPHGPGHGNGHGHGHGHGHGRNHNHWCYRDVTHCRTSCAPEVEEGNLQATTRVLTDLASQAEFANAARFRSEIARIAAIADSRAQFGEYLKLVGLENGTDEELLEFIGAREVEAIRVERLKASTDLNSDQAQKVIDALTTALKGNLR